MRIHKYDLWRLAKLKTGKEMTGYSNKIADADDYRRKILRTITFPPFPFLKMTLPREGMTQSHSRGNPTRPVSQLFAATDVEGKTFAPQAQSPQISSPGQLPSRKWTCPRHQRLVYKMVTGIFH